MRAFCIWCRAKKAIHVRGFPDSSTGEESGCNAGEHGSIAGWGKNPPERDRLPTPVFLGFPGDLDGKESACNAGDLGSISGLGRSPVGGHHPVPVFLPGECP